MKSLSFEIVLYQLIIYSLIIYADKQEILSNNTKIIDNSSLCPSYLFRCDTIRCLPYAFVCNGEYNCHDKTDETNCSTAIINNDLCNTNDSINCEQDILHSTRLVEHGIHYEYTRPVQICIKRSSVCDGVIDCRDAIDEQCTQRNPLITCLRNEYHCKITNRCIPKTWLCNGINDCLDPFSSDELDCPMMINCTSNEFTCQSKNQCIPSTAVCDGIQDCADASDESPSLCRFLRFCARDQFVCKSTKLCIPKSNVCDTISQCHDQSDEMSCSCPIEDYVSEKLFYRCGLTNKCLPKNLECDIKRQCNPRILEEDNNECPSLSSLINRPCVKNNTCLGENQYCQNYPYKHCICQIGYRMNESTGICEDIDECRERVICDHYCINTRGSYRCSCHENYQLKSDKHTCTLRTNLFSSASLYGLFDNGIYKLDMNKENELDKIKESSNLEQINSIPNNNTLIILTNHAYLLDHDPVENDLYFAECLIPIRPILMSCPKTRGIFRINLNKSMSRKELVIDGRDYTSIQSLAIDWLHRNIYFVNTRLQTIDVCRLNGSFCHVLLHQTISDYLPQRILLYPEKGLLFYTSIVKSRAQHIIRLGMDGTNFKLFFTIKTMNDIENVNYLRPLLTIDRINHYLYFYNGFDKIFVLNMHGEILHIQYQTINRFHSFKIFADKMYKAFADISGNNYSEFRINPKYALGTTLLGPGFIFDIDRVVQTFYNKSSRFEENSWLLNSLHNLYYLRYPIYMIDFIIIDSNENKGKYQIVKNQCEQLCFPNAINQTEITCGCGQYYNLADDGLSCISNCPEHFFNCQLSKKCIPFYQHCDGIIDCIFGEDENNCQLISCNKTSSFRCSSNSKCLTTDDLCNNITDCILGEDEHDLICGHFCEWPSLNTCIKKYPNLCSDTEFYCDGKCVSITHRCDDKPYCYDGADEPFDCINVTCPYEYFKCPLSGKCIPYEKVCDNFDDCPIIDRINGITADETSQACNFVLSQLTNLTTITPQIHMTCESADLFRCKTSHFCINRTYVCDGDLDCSDSSDEENCEDNNNDIISLSLHKDYTCMNGYRCIQQRHELDDYQLLCIPLNELCDGINQCPLGDDEHTWRCRNCTDCDPISSFCELINRLPVCQCKKGYVKIMNGSCILEDNLCNWSYGICSHVKLSQTNNDGDFCIKKKSYINCQCDRGYEMKKNNDDSISCIVKSNQTFDVMLNPRASFYLYQHGSIFAPINPSHHVIDAVFVRIDKIWCILYTEQRNGHAFIWQQKFNSLNQLQNNTTQIWSSSIFQFTLLKVDWIHRFIYALYDDPSSSSNGIEILYANKDDYTQLTFVNRLTFSNMKIISSINVHPLQGYLYISAYYDAQHSFIYRSLLDGSNLEIFLTPQYPVLSMTLDYRHPRLYIILSNGEIESYSIDISQPWKQNVYNFQNNIDLRPYSIDLYDDILVVMIFNITDSIYDEIWIDKFGKLITEKSRKLKTPMIIRYIHEFKYPTIDTSDMVNQVCSDSSCPNGRICISTPSYRPLCITPGQMNLCGSSCHTRGICSNGECVCSNQTYTGDDCEMCRLTDQINVGCFNINNNPQLSCMCYLTRSKTRQTPYLCTTLKNDRGEIEVPCDRIISPLKREYCLRTLFLEPSCEGTIYSLIFHIQTQSCICRETMNRKINCFTNGLLIINDNDNSSTCSCSFPFYGNQCELNQCQNYCRNNGSCLINNTDLICNCSNGFTGEQCQYKLCQSINCQDKEQCFIENNKPICRCPIGRYCHNRKRLHWGTWILIIIICVILSFIGYTFLRYNSKLFRLKYLFAHHRLHEQIGLEINSTNTIYSHVPTNEMNSHDRPLEDVLFDENEISTSRTINNRTEEFMDDPFYVDENEPIFSNDRNLNTKSNVCSTHTGIL